MNIQISLQNYEIVPDACGGFIKIPQQPQPQTIATNRTIPLNWYNSKEETTYNFYLL